MTKVVVTEEYLADTGDAIREKNGGTATYTPAQFGPAIRAIDTSGNTGSKTISANGTYSASSDSLDGYDEVTVNVPNTYASGDEGKVVSSGALVAQTTRNVSANGTYDTTTNDSTVVNVQPNVGSKSIVANGSYPASADSLDGYSDVSVNVPNSYAAADEGKVVSSGALVAQSGLRVSANGTYDTTLNDEVIVNVSGGGGSTLGTKSITANGTYDAADDSLDGYSQVTVSVPTSGGGMAGLIERSLSEVYDAQASYVGSWAFVSNQDILSVNLPNAKGVYSQAFRYCSSLVSVVMESCETLDDYAFGNCIQIENLSFPQCRSVQNNVFGQCSSLKSVSLPNCTYIGQYAFNSCILLESIHIPNVTSVTVGCFSNCHVLSYVNLPQCKVVHNSAFYQCYGLKSIVLPLCSMLYSGIFLRCSSLESVYLLGPSVASITGTTFSNTPIALSSYLGYFGSIFVPESLVDAYKSSSRWSNYSDRIVGLTDAEIAAL